MAPVLSTVCFEVPASRQDSLGYFIPARAARKELDRVALKKAASKMDELLQREGLTEAELDELTKDFRSWRKARK